MEFSIQGRKVREVARIKGFGDQNPGKGPSISIQKLQGKSSGSDRVVISFSGEQSTSSKQFKYEVDHCYDHEAGTDVVFSEEIKPLISSVFEGKSATVFAYGARGSGKTYTIQGTENVPGLISLSMSEFLSRSEELGNSVSISLYEVLQDRVFDLLDSKRPEISVLEGAHGKIASVKSIPEFHKLWFAILQRPLQKTTNEPPQRSHKGMIINISSSQEDASLLGRMNLVDLAGYEDKRQSVSGPNLFGISIINKSLYAIHNVLHALKSNDTRVPYRESKLTRMLQDSLGGMNRILMITCMDPSFSEDTIKTLSLASRSCQVVNKTKVDPTPNVRSIIKPTMTPVRSSQQTLAHSSKPVKVASSSASTRKQVTSVYRSIDRKPQDVKVQGRRLFGELKSDNKKKETMPKKKMEATESSRQKETMTEKNLEVVESSRQEDTNSEENMEVTESSNELEEDMFKNNMELFESSTEQEGNDCAVTATQLSLVVSSNDAGVSTPSIVQPISAFPRELDNLVGEIPIDHCSLVTPGILEADKENKSTTLSIVASPPLSARLQELSNNLKSLYTSTPMNMKSEISENYNSIKDKEKLGGDLLEPTTPVSQSTANTKKCQYTSIMSPWERLQIRSTGVKESFVKECLMFINSASKDELKGLKIKGMMQNVAGGLFD
ncbi:hypothetical protein V2J09_005773 [Rumex salicifolius]